MAKTLQEYFQEFVNLSHEERVERAGSTVGTIVNFLKANDFDDQKVVQFFVYVTALFTKADGVTAYEEYKLFNDVTGFNVKEADFRAMMESGDDPEFVNQMDKVIDSMSEEAKGAVCYYGLAFIAADDTITVEEQKVFLKILG